MTLRYGMVGGGPGAFIGAVHRMAAALDGEWRLVGGAFSADPGKSSEMGAELGLDAARVHGSYEAMAEAEAALPSDERIHAVAIVTPNHLHHPVARTFLTRGIHVVCDKPFTTTVPDAEELCRLSAERGLVCAVTYNYTGYPMVKEARALVRDGALGQLRKVVVEYSQGWLRTLLEADGQKQAEWRGDPERAGVSSALGDIGSHAYDLVRYVAGLDATRLFADLGTVVEGRRMEDDATVLLELEGGVRGLLFASQIATGERNHLRLRVYGSDRGIDWSQERPDRLRIVEADGSERIVWQGAGAVSDAAITATRLPGGHPEGFVEAFANLYRGAAHEVRAIGDARLAAAEQEGESAAGVRSIPAFSPDVRTAVDGAHGVDFIHRAVESDRSGAWVDVRFTPSEARPASAPHLQPDDATT